MSIKYNGGYIPAVGADGTTLVANSASATGVAWAGPTFTAGKNKIINGDFGIWQRGTTITSPGNGGYSADRFFNGQDGTGTVTCTQQTFTPGTAPVAGYEGSFFLRTSLTSLGTTTYFQPTQRIEDVRTFAGQTATVSFWAKADSARTSLIVLIQNFGSGGSGATTQASAVTYSTAWTRYTATFTVGSMSGKTIGTGSSLEIGFRTTAAVGSVLDIWGVQVEAGSVATPFTTATGTLSGELTACQRYYYRWTTANGGSTSAYIHATWSLGTTSAYGVFNFPVTLRTTPSTLETTGTASNYRLLMGGTVTTCSAVPSLDQANPYGMNILYSVTAGLVVGQAGVAGINASSNAYLGFSAEL